MSHADRIDAVPVEGVQFGDDEDTKFPRGSSKSENLRNFESKSTGASLSRVMFLECISDDLHPR